MFDRRGAFLGRVSLGQACPLQQGVSSVFRSAPPQPVAAPVAAPAPAPVAAPAAAPYPTYTPAAPVAPLLTPPPPPIPTPAAQAFAIESAGSPIEDILSIGSVGAVVYLAASAFGLV